MENLEDTRLQSRNNEFQNSLNSIQKQRAKHQVELRRNQRFQHFEGIRSKLAITGKQMNDLKNIEDFYAQYSTIKPNDTLYSKFQWIEESLNEQQPVQEVCKILQYFRHLTIQKGMDYTHVRSSGLIPIIVNFCNYQAYGIDVAKEATWILTNIASDVEETTNLVIQAGAVQAFFSCLGSQNPDIRQHGLWGLTNIVYNTKEDARNVLNFDLLPQLNILLNQLSQNDKENELIFAQMASLLQAIMRQKLQLSESERNEIYQLICRFIAIPFCQLEAYWALAYSTETFENVGWLRNQQLWSIVLNYYNSTQNEFIIPSSRIIGNIAAGNSVYIPMIMTEEVLSRMLSLMHSSSHQIRLEQFWTVSNIIASGTEFIDQLLNHTIIIQALRGINDNSSNVRREAGYIYYNLSRIATDSQLWRIIELNSLNQIDQSLEGYDSELITLLQAFLLKALQCGDRNRDEQGGNRIAYLCQETNLIEKIDKLTGHGNPKVSENARMLFRDYFEVQNNEDALMMETDEFRI